MTTQTLDKLIWTFLYGGLLAMGLGVSIASGDAVLGWRFVIGGGAIAVVGVILIYVRSRIDDKG